VAEALGARPLVHVARRLLADRAARPLADDDRLHLRQGLLARIQLITKSMNSEMAMTTEELAYKLVKTACPHDYGKVHCPACATEAIERAKSELTAERNRYEHDLQTTLAAFHLIHKLHVDEMPGHKSCHCPTAVAIYQIEDRLRESGESRNP
jgi:hypothetical protein